MPDTKHEHEGMSRFARARLVLSALFLAVTGIVAWRRPRHRAAAAQQGQREEAARIDRLRRRGHEANDVEVGPIAAIGFLFFLVLGGSLFGLWFFLGAVTGTVQPPAAALMPLEAPVQRPGGVLPTATVAPLQARLQVRPQDHQRLQTQWEQRLQSYGWIDRDAGIVHIPIGRAIDLVVERGLPTREEP